MLQRVLVREIHGQYISDLELRQGLIDPRTSGHIAPDLSSADAALQIKKMRWHNIPGAVVKLRKTKVTGKPFMGT